VSRVAKPPLGPHPVAVADQQPADRPLRVHQGPPREAVEEPRLPPRPGRAAAARLGAPSWPALPHPSPGESSPQNPPAPALAVHVHQGRGVTPCTPSGGRTGSSCIGSLAGPAPSRRLRQPVAFAPDASATRTCVDFLAPCPHVAPANVASFDPLSP
jgi:hypothetical protein